MNTASAHYHRPFQSSGGGGIGSNSSVEKQGRKLLDLIRSRDKLIGNQQKKASDDDDDDDDDDQILQIEQEITSRLHSLNASLRRCGLFANDSEKAQSYYNHAAQRSSSVSSSDRTAENNGGDGGGGSKKRKRKKGGANGGGSANSGVGTGLSAASYGIYLDSHSSASFAGLSSSGGGEEQDLDEGLVLTAICRILGVAVGRKKKSENDEDASAPRGPASYGLLCAAINTLSSLCDHANDGMIPSISLSDGSTICASIEADMVASIGSPLLDALWDNVLFLYYKNSEEEIMLKGLADCFKACASAISLLGMRLSRAEKTIENLRENTWLVLNNINGLSGNREDLCNVQKAAAASLATLPLTGNSGDSKTTTQPSQIWSKSVTDGITLLRWAIHDFFPMPTVSDGSSKKSGNNNSDSIKEETNKHPKLCEEHEKWLSISKEAPANDDEELDLGNDPTDSHRSQALQSRIQCLTSYIDSLLKMEHYPLHKHQLNNNKLLLSIDALLDVSEILLSFPLAAEAQYRSVKSRLRSSPVKNGLISPKSALGISADIRLCGHDLFNDTVNMCRGGSGVLGRARRLVGMAVANLQSSCSLPLVSVVVDGSGRRGGGIGGGRISKMGSWLRGSIHLRIQSIQTFQSVAISLGGGSMSSVGTKKSMCRALVLLGGSLLEQVAVGGNEMAAGAGDEWGTLGERAKLVETSSGALASCIAALGGLIPNNVRGTLDSITHTCLSTLYSFGGSSIFAYSHVKRSILQLGMNCACVPWGDGGCSTVAQIVRTVSNMLRADADLSVASMALSTLCALDALATPRAPPILIPTRGATATLDRGMANDTSGMTASSLLQGMKETKDTIEEQKQKESSKKKESNKRAKKKEVKAKVETKASSSDTTGQKMSADNSETDKQTTMVKEQSLPPNKHGKNKVNANPKGSNESSPNKQAESSSGGGKPESGDSGTGSGEVDIAESSKNDPQDKPQKMEAEPNNNHHNPAAVKEDSIDVEMKDENDDHDDSSKESGGDDGSLSDFPDIIDEDPDEEDKN